MARSPTTTKTPPKPAQRRPEPDAGPVIVKHQQERREIFIGPLPHPDILRQYNELEPGFAARLLTMTEQEALHRRQIERQALDISRAQIRRGQLFGLIIGVCGLASAVLAAYFNQTAVGVVLGGGTVLGLVSAFVLGRVIRPK